MSFDTGYTIDTVSILLEFFTNEGKISYNQQNNELAIKNWNKYNGSDSPKVQSCVAQELVSVKDRLLIEYVYGIDSVSILDPNKNKNNKKKKNKNKTFSPVGFKKGSVDNGLGEDHNGNPNQDLTGMVW